jgi:hypothetical protein
LRIVGSGTTRGVTMTSVVATNCRSNWTSRTGRLVRTVSGPVENRPRTRPSSGYSTTRRQLRSALSTRNLGRLPSSRAPTSSSSRIAAGSRPSWPSTIWPVIGDPSGTWAGSIERSHDIRRRARDTRITQRPGAREQQSEPHHVALTGDHRDQHHGDAGDQKDPASCGEQSPGFPHLRSGMCTDWIAWAMMSVTVRRAS